MLKSIIIQMASGTDLGPDPLGSEPVGRIRIRSNCSDPDPTIKVIKHIRNIISEIAIFVI